MTSEAASVPARFADSQRALLLHRYGHTIDRSQRVLDRWEARWAGSLMEAIPTLSDRDIELLVRAAASDSRPVLRAVLGPRLRAAAARVLEPMRDRVVSASRWYIRSVSDDAGQHALDLLGINRPWKWGDQSAADRLQSAQGSKAIAGLYDKHVDRLTKIVQTATRKRDPLSPEQVRDLIRAEWSALTKSQAELIAKTETAYMWEATNFVALVGNGVDSFDWIVAVSPTIGADGVCKRCLAVAAGNPYNARHAPLPPRHPLCRCTLVPSLSTLWTAPKNFWTGGGS